MSKDPFQELVDELTALRRSIEHIARTSLDKDEAKTLNQAVAQAALKMAKATKNAPGEIQEALASDRDQMARREAWRWFGGSGCGWPLCSPQGPLSGRWRWRGLLGAAMPASSGSFQASTVAPQADQSRDVWITRTIAISSAPPVCVMA